MILQWVKLCEPHFNNQMSIGSKISYPCNNQRLVLGNRCVWKRENMWKCIEQINDNIVEHIVHMTGVHEPIVPILSKYIPVDINTYTHTYTSAIAHYTNDTATTLGGILLPQVMNTCRYNGDIYLLNILTHWLNNHPEIFDISPNSNDIIQGMDISNESTIDKFLGKVHNTVDNRNISTSSEAMNLVLHNVWINTMKGVDGIVAGLHEILSDVYEEVKAGRYGPTSIDSELTEIFLPWKTRYGCSSSMCNRKSFASGDISPGEIQNKCIRNFVRETVAPCPISGMPSFRSDYHIIEAEYTKELSSIVSTIQTFNLTDFEVTFDINGFIDSTGYRAINVWTINRYFADTDRYGFKFPYLPEDNARMEYSFIEYTDELGLCLCNYILTNHTELFDLYDTATLIKTYNEELVIQFSTYDNKSGTSLYVDLLAFVIGGLNFGKVCKS